MWIKLIVDYQILIILFKENLFSGNIFCVYKILIFMNSF